MNPQISKYFQTRKLDAIKFAQTEFAKRTDDVEAINVAIGNISLPTHPSMQKRMFNLNAEDSPFKDGVISYSSTIGREETNDAILNIIASSGFKTDKLYSQITSGGTHAMELVSLGVSGDAGTDEKPLLMIDATYTHYNVMAKRVGRSTVSVSRYLEKDGKFSFPDMSVIEKMIEDYDPGAIVVIPYDNPTGQLYDKKTLMDIGNLCVKNNLWMISDEAYRELYYSSEDAISIWGLNDEDVPGIEGRRISIETASKVWNSCGLRIGALVTDNKEYHDKSVIENTANLCSNVIGQYIFGALAHESHENLNRWYDKQRKHYKGMMRDLTEELKKTLSGIIVSNPDASIYSVVDVREISKEFDAVDFVKYCAQKGKVDVVGEDMTLLVSPMKEFYTVPQGSINPGDTQMRIAYVASPEKMKLVPKLFKNLFEQYIN